MTDDWTMADAVKETFSIEEFALAYAIAVAASSGAMPTTSPTEFKIAIEDEGDTTTYAFTDTPHNRMMFALKEHFGRTQRLKAAAFMFRLWALGALMADPRMRRWTRDVDGRSLIFEGVGEAAAALPLDATTLAFNADEFFAAVEAVNASGKYRDTGEVW